MNKNIKIIYITNLPSPYVIDYLNILTSRYTIHVAFERKNSNDRIKEWFRNDFKFNYQFLKGVNLGPENSFKPNIIKFLFQDYDVYFCDYSSFSGLLFYIVKLLFFPKKRLIAIIDGAKYTKVNKIKALIKRIIFRAVNLFISSGFQADNYLLMNSVPKEKIRRYFFTSLFKKDFLQKEYSNFELKKLKIKYGITDKFTILYVGRFIQLKRIDVLLEASNQLKFDHNIVLVGGQFDKFTKNLLSLNKSNNLYVFNFMPPEKIKEFYLFSDMLYLNSNSEAWGLVVNEALANGLPVLTNSNCVAGLELIKDNSNGIVMEYNNSNAIAVSKKIVSFYKNREFKKLTISQSIRHYNLENVADQISKVIDEVIQND
jgi:glycosyltransferase involved in cell wall biosynthesis